MRTIRGDDLKILSADPLDMDKKEAMASYRRMENRGSRNKCQLEKKHVRTANLLLLDISFLSANRACPDDR